MRKPLTIVPALNNTRADEAFNAELIRAQRLIEDAIMILSSMQDSQGIELATPPSTLDIVDATNKAATYLHEARAGIPCITPNGGIRRYPEGEVAAIIHYSDCAIYNMPAYPNGPCNCSAGEVK